MDIFNSNGDQLYYPQVDTLTNQVMFVKKEDHVFLKRFKDNYRFFLVASLLYAVLFTFCMYRNIYGITTTIYPIASVFYILISARKINVAYKKDTTFFIIAMCLIAINICTTQDYVVLLLDHIAIFLLTMSMSLHIFFDDSKWGIGKYLSEIISTFFCQLEFAFSVFADGANYKKENSNNKTNPIVGYVIVGIIIAMPLLVVVLMLLGSADYFFGKFIADAIIEPLNNIRFDNIDMLVMLGLSFLASYAFVRKLCAQNISETVNESPNMPAAIAITINMILGFVYLIFSGFQVFTLFLGNGELPSSYTYAEYAREGFFQLVVVCIINMILVLVCLYISEESRFLKGCLCVISASTFLMIVSSTYRMYMYVSVYQLTYTRVFVFWALIVIFMAMVGITIYIFNDKFNLFSYCMIMVTVLYIAFAYINPEGLIAKNNLSEKFYQSEECQSIDYNYLMRLSSNATPIMVEAFMRENDEYGMDKVISQKKENNEMYRDELSFRQFNFSILREYMVVKDL